MSKLLFSCFLLSIGPMSIAMQADSVEGEMKGGLEAPDRPVLAANQDGVTLDQAVEQVRRQHNGRIVSAETRVSGGREIHIIKVLTSDGKVKTVRIQGRRV